MKKPYEELEMEVIRFRTEDIITTSEAAPAPEPSPETSPEPDPTQGRTPFVTNQTADGAPKAGDATQAGVIN